jgi:lysophospholipid acyltransferase (LPLAT)-like uncharacterized protein
MNNKLKNKFLNLSGKYLLSTLININNSILRLQIVNKPIDTSNKIFIFWHSKMLIGWWLFKKENYLALVSKSKDGDILTRLLYNWKYNVIRGSSSKGGKDALEQIINDISNGNSVVITPDGPRGPAREIKNGALIISNKTGYPIIPVKINYSRKKILNKSWDKFEIPLPFSKCEVSFGKHFYYKEFLYDNDLSNFKQEISSQM